MRTMQYNPPHPGEILKGIYLKENKITAGAFAKALGVSRLTVYKIINAKGSVTANIALRLSKAFDTTPEYWLNLQNNYDLWHVSRESSAWKHVRALVHAPAPA